MREEGQAKWVRSRKVGTAKPTDNVPSSKPLFGFFALEQGNVQTPWEWDFCLNFSKKGKERRKASTPTPQTGPLDTSCLDSWQTMGCHSQTQNNYLLACYFIWLPKSGLFHTEPWKNTLHLLRENKTA